MQMARTVLKVSANGTFTLCGVLIFIQGDLHFIWAASCVFLKCGLSQNTVVAHKYDAAMNFTA
jgi:hypothetical protein